MIEIFVAFGIAMLLSYILTKLISTPKTNKGGFTFPIRSHNGIKPPTTKTRPPKPPSQYVFSSKGYGWIDMDAEYFMLEDPERTPLKIKQIKKGVVRLESSNNSHHITCGIGNLNEYVSVFKKWNNSYKSWFRQS